MQETTATVLAAIGGLFTALIVLAGLAQLPGSLTSADGIAIFGALVVTAGFAALVVISGRTWGGPETAYW